MQRMSFQEVKQNGVLCFCRQKFGPFLKMSSNGSKCIMTMCCILNMFFFMAERNYEKRKTRFCVCHQKIYLVSIRQFCFTLCTDPKPLLREFTENKTTTPLAAYNYKLESCSQQTHYKILICSYISKKRSGLTCAPLNIIIVLIIRW